jgi:hypothetical protein
MFGVPDLFVCDVKRLFKRTVQYLKKGVLFGSRGAYHVKCQIVRTERLLEEEQGQVKVRRGAKVVKELNVVRYQGVGHCVSPRIA